MCENYCIDFFFFWCALCYVFWSLRSKLVFWFGNFWSYSYIERASKITYSFECSLRHFLRAPTAGTLKVVFERFKKIEVMLMYYWNKLGCEFLSCDLELKLLKVEELEVQKGEKLNWFVGGYLNVKAARYCSLSFIMMLPSWK